LKNNKILLLLIAFIILFLSIPVKADYTPESDYYIMVVNDYFKKTEYKDVADIITAMATHESGWMNSGSHLCRNNFFSLKGDSGHDCNGNVCKKPICKMRRFKSITDGLDEQLKYFQDYKFPPDRKGFLKALTCVPKYTDRCVSYAEDKEHLKHISDMIYSLKKRDLF